MEELNKPSCYSKKALRGIEIRTKKDGSERYRARIRKKGHDEVSRTYRTETLARKNKHRIENELEADRSEFKSPDKHTFNELTIRYMESILPQNPKNARNKRRHLLWWNKKFGHLLLRDVKPNLIALARDELLATKTKKGTLISPTTVVRYLSSLSHVFSTAVKEWEWIRENPVFKIKKPQPAKGRLRFLSIEEKDRLLAVCQKSKSKDLYLIVVLAICTGMRKGEILNLRRRNIDFEKNAIWLEETKNNEQRFVPLVGLPLELLKSKCRNHHDDSLIFPSPQSQMNPIDIRRAWENALKKADIKNCVFHSTRHTAASYLAMEGSSLIEIAALLGHKTLQTAKKYAHLSDKHLHQTAEILQSKIFSS